MVGCGEGERRWKGPTALGWGGSDVWLELVLGEPANERPCLGFYAVICPRPFFSYVVICPNLHRSVGERGGLIASPEMDHPHGAGGRLERPLGGGLMEMCRKDVLAFLIELYVCV